MRKLLLFIFCASILEIQSQTPNLQWAKKLGDISNSDIGISVGNDLNGNVYSVGSFYGTLDADPSVSNYYLYTSGGWDTYISKLDINGNFVWAKKIGGINDDLPTEIKVDQNGNSFISGNFSGIVDFDPSSTGTYTLNGSGLGENFLLKLDASGNFVWVKQFTSTDLDLINSISLDMAGNLVLAGRLYGVMDFDPSPISSYTLSSSPTVCSFICKLDNNGNFLWAKKYGFSITSSNAGLAHSVKTDANNNIYASGFFYGTADFDPSAASYPLTANGNTQDAYVAKFDSNGNLKWADNFGSIYFDDALSSAIDTKGNVYITGYFGGIADFNPSTTSTFTIANNNSSNDVFVAKVDSSGNFVWAKKIGGDYDDQSNYITTDNSNNVYVSGGFEYICDFDPSNTTTYSLTSNGAKDGFVTKLDENGNFIWNATFGAISSDFASYIQLDNAGSILVTGHYERTVDFDPSSSVFNLSGNTGNSDAFVWKLNSSSTGIYSLGNPNKRFDVLLFPNPAKDVLTIAISGNYSETSIITIQNMLGDEVFKETIETNSKSIDINGLTSGIYFITLTNQEVQSTQKIVIE